MVGGLRGVPVDPVDRVDLFDRNASKPGGPSKVWNGGTSGGAPGPKYSSRITITAAEFGRGVCRPIGPKIHPVLSSSDPMATAAQPRSTARLRGTSRAYLIDRLRREGHDDLVAAIEAGVVSAFAVAVELGWLRRENLTGTGATNQ